MLNILNIIPIAHVILINIYYFQIMTSQSQSLSQFGLYGQQGLGMPPQQQQQQQQQAGMPRGIPTPQQTQQQQQNQQQAGFPRSSIGGHITPTSSGMPMQSGLPPHAPTSPNRGLVIVCK